MRHISLSRSMLCALGLVLGVFVLSAGCSQRAHLHSEFGLSSQQLFYRQLSSPPVQLAPTTAEDAKRISESRARRSADGSTNRPRRIGGTSGGSLLQ